MPISDQSIDQDPMVLRTVYLPLALDVELKKLAFHGGTSKSELIRRAITNMVDETDEASKKNSDAQSQQKK